MSYTPGLNDFDPEFEDPINLVPERSRSVLRETKHENWESQQVIVNPFPLLLAPILCQIAAVALWGSRPINAVPVMVLSTMGCMIMTSRLVQFHCLDCGGTYRIKGWRKHACPGLLDRIRARKTRRLRLPSAGFQFAFYLWFIYPITLLILFHAVFGLEFQAAGIE